MFWFMTCLPLVCNLIVSRIIPMESNSAIKCCNRANSIPPCSSLLSQYSLGIPQCGMVCACTHLSCMHAHSSLSSFSMHAGLLVGLPCMHTHLSVGIAHMHICLSVAAVCMHAGLLVGAFMHACFALSSFDVHACWFFSGTTMHAH